jgi:hypothetical protein
MYDIGKYHFIVDEDDRVKTGTNESYYVFPLGNQPLKISLVWTDVRGTTSATKHLINDLNLKVTDPDGNIYYGNYDLNNSHWSTASSTPKPDRLNNVENVFVQNPKPGPWKIEVDGYNVPQDGDTRTGATDQTFALVAAGVKQGRVKHDLAVLSVRSPEYAAPNTPTYVNATLFNLGVEDETNINVNLTMNGTKINSTTISSFQNYTSTDVEFIWYPTTGIHTAAVEITPVAGESNITNNVLSTSVIAEPDVSVSFINMTEYGVLNKQTIINATLENLGKIDLKNINVSLSVNGTLNNWTYTDLSASGTDYVYFNWTPGTNGPKTIKIEALPVANESLIGNNNKTRSSFVTPYEPVNVFVLDSWGNDNPPSWDSLNRNWQWYGRAPLTINYTAFKGVNINYQDLTLSGADVLLISSAYFSQYEFLDSEISDIINYTKEGHGLVTTSFTFNPWAQNNNKFAPFVGFGKNASSDFSFVLNSGMINAFYPSHPLFKNITSPYAPGSGSLAYSIIPKDGSWDDFDLGAGVMLGGNRETGDTTIIDNHGVYYISNYLEYNPNPGDYQLLYNALTTSNYTTYPVDVALRNFSGPVNEVPFAENTSFNVSVHNLGNQILNNVEIFLNLNNTQKNSTIISTIPEGAYTNISFNWTADMLGSFNATINVTEQPGETYLYDNNRTAMITVLPNPEISVMPDQFDFIMNESEQLSMDLSIQNSGFNELDFSISTGGVSWLSTNISAGDIKVGSQQLINVTFGSPSITKGHYYGTITITSNDIDEPITLIPVHLKVYGPLRYIKIEPDNFTTHTDLAVQYTAFGHNINHNIISFTRNWATNDSIGWITGGGMYYPGQIGNFSIYCNETPGVVTNFTSVNVELSDLDHIDITPPTWSGTADDTITFSASGFNVTNFPVEFTKIWQTDDPFGTVIDGLYRPGKVGTWNVSCENLWGTVISKATVTVSAGGLTWLSISPNTWTGKSTLNAQFTATGYDAHDNIADFTRVWSTDDPNGTIALTGLYTAGKVGKWNITCENGPKTVSSSIEVTVFPGDIDAIKITPSTVNMSADETIQFSAVGLDLNKNEFAITPSWEANGGGIIDKDTGKFVANQVGTWWVFANYSGLSAMAWVEITYGSITSIKITPENEALSPNEEQQFSASGFDSDLNPRPTSPTWEVNGGGIINPVSGVFTAKWAGTWKVYANESGVSGSTFVVVLPGEPTFIIVKPQGEDVVAGDTLQFSAEGRDAFGNKVLINPIWEINGGGNINSISGLFYAENAGSWTVTARVGDISGTVNVRVLNGALKYVVIEPSYIELTTDNVQLFNATGYDDFNNPIAIVPSWSSNGGGVINDSGLFTPDTIGRWDIKAEYLGIKGVATVIITFGKAESITVSPNSANLKIGESINFDAKASDSRGNIMDIFPKWAVDESAGVINSEGIFYAKKPGTWKITATYDGASGFADVNVDIGTDTDNDGMSDEWELEYGFDPLRDSDADEDFDNDTLSNLDEYKNGTNPLNIDTDGDTMDDDWELTHSLDPNDPTDANVDTDGDSFPNIDEYNADTDPTDRTKHPPVERGSVGDAGADNNYMLIMLLILVIIIICIIVLIWAYTKRREEKKTARMKGEEEPDIIDVDFEIDEADESLVFELDEEPPPPPPPKKIKFKKVGEEKVKKKDKKGKKRAKVKEKPEIKVKPVMARKKTIKKKVKKGKPKKDLKKTPSKRKTKTPPSKVELQKFECPQCSEPIKVPYTDEKKVSIQCTFCGGKGKIPNPYLKKKAKGKKRPERRGAEFAEEKEEDEMSWDDEVEEEPEEEFEVDEISWDDHMRYRPDDSDKDKEMDILWDDDDEKPYKRAKKKTEDEFLWD